MKSMLQFVFLSWLFFSPILLMADKKTPSKENISDVEARLELVKVLSYQKKYEEALREVDKILSEYPDMVEAKIEKAKVFFYKKDTAQGLAILEQIPKEKKQDEVQILIANAYLNDEQYDKAEPLFENYVKKHPEDLKTKLRFAEMLSWQKKYDSSIKEYEDILKQRPTDIQVRRKYAMVLIWMGNTNQGAEELRKTLEEKKSN